MNKTLFGLLTLCAASSAAADSVGAYVGTGIGVFYRNGLDATSDVRVSLDLNAVNLFRGGALSLGGDVAYLRDIPSGANLGGVTGLNTYYGAGLGAYASLGSTTGVGLRPHALVGLEYQVTAPLNVFVEGSVGPLVLLSTGGSTFDLLSVGARLGVNYTFR